MVESAPAQPAAGRRLAGMALLASILAVVLAGGSLWLIRVEQSGTASLQSRLDGLERSLERVSTDVPAGAELARLEQRLAAAEQAASEPRQDPALAALEQRVARSEGEIAREFEAIRGRLAQIEQDAAAALERIERQLAAAPTETAAPEQARLEVEARTLLRIEDLLTAARDRFQLLGDVQTARRAWDDAIERIDRLDSPDSDLDGLRQRLQAERDALGAVSGNDRAALVSELLGAALEVDDWPTRGAQAAQAAPGAGQAPAVADGWRARFSQLVDRLVKVERLDIEYLDPAELDSARRSVTAMLETLALVLARRDDAVAARLAAAAERRVRSVFDPDTAAVGVLLQRLGSLANPQDLPEPPLDASVDELRRLIEVRR